MIDPTRPSTRHVVYTAGPITAKNGRTVEQNVEVARRIAIELWKAGWTVICPHTNVAEAVPGFTLEDYLLRDKELIFRSDAICLLPFWRESVGTLEENDFAARCWGGRPALDYTVFLPDYRA